MSKIKYIIPAILIGLVSGQAKAEHNSNECPLNMAGNYQTKDGKKMLVSTVNMKGGHIYTFGEGAPALIADGTSHDLEKGATYVATCEKGVVNTQVLLNGRVVAMMSHSIVNQNGDLRAITVGTAVEPSDLIWVKQ